MESKARILVVDDEHGIRQACLEVLTAEGYIVETAADGVEGLVLFEDRKDFTAVLVDLKMPRMGGMELIERIHGLDEDVCILVITAYATIETAVQATKLGADNYILKPFTPDELLLPVKNSLERRALALEANALRMERERNLLDLAFERSKCGAIIHCMADGVIVINRDAQIVLCNAAANKMLSWSPDHLFPIPLASIRFPALRELLEETITFPSSLKITSKEIKLGDVTYLANASPVIDPGGSPLGGVGILRDIAELKDLETAKSMFISRVIHELQSPLGAIEIYLDLALSELAGKDSGQNQEMIRRSLQSTKMLRELVDKLMSLRAMETGPLTLSRVPLNIVEVVRNALDACRDKALEKKIDMILNAELDEKPPEVLADGNSMKIVFENLFGNAITDTPEGGKVQVDLVWNGMYVDVVIRDTGEGMTDEEMERIFDEFFWVKNEDTAGILGTGLELCRVKKLLDLHHGKITVESKPAEGSRFTVSLPIHSNK